MPAAERCKRHNLARLQSRLLQVNMMNSTIPEEGGEYASPDVTMDAISCDHESAESKDELPKKIQPQGVPRSSSQSSSSNSSSINSNTISVCD
ncbi:hypothetical protein KIN20_013931 [Parelaphostrongylus tenuis]|uniref:Uncharacterized protein n=1 Tax=Parelaphostrongylus tenuis TaxID=148309 RepID=A0AAD5MV64_PARTN|nr:hypothetical protein KIN20_013931 [Parelaphostrongylus tenuis]